MNTTQEERLKYLTDVVETVKRGLEVAASDEAHEQRLAVFCQDLKNTFGDRLMIRFDPRIPKQFHYQFETPVSLEYRSEVWDRILVELFENVEHLLSQNRGAVFTWTAIYEKYNSLRADFMLGKGLLSDENFRLLDAAIEQACLEAEEKSEHA